MLIHRVHTVLRHQPAILQISPQGNTPVIRNYARSQELYPDIQDVQEQFVTFMRLKLYNQLLHLGAYQVTMTMQS